ncbi:hypothetical protein [Streptomyces sp. NPDC016845]|uniref:hypothetical protein n=1 Tax=Streptomyces sp. NPDC016845 TaxID=3364972 RepID=UPI0037AC3CB3
MSGASRGFGGLIQRGPMAVDVVGAYYTTVFNHAVRDRRLSRRARGLLVELLSHQDGYGISLAALLRAGPEGKAALTTALRELESYEYLRRYRARDERGRLGDTLFHITDMPHGLTLTAPAPPPRHDDRDSPAPASGTPEAHLRRPEPESENRSLDTEAQPRRSEPESDFPALGNPALENPPPKKNNLKKTNQQNTNPLPPSAPSTRKTDGTDATTTARGEATLLSIARHHPELHAALATGSTLADQAPLVGRLLAGGVPREHIREALVGRPYPPPSERTHSLAALVAARLRQLALLAAAGERAPDRPRQNPSGPAVAARWGRTVVDVVVRKHECEGRDGLCGLPVGAPGELCPTCARLSQGEG